MENQERLIHGKENTQRIVSLEVEDNKTILFIEHEDGRITQEIKPNKFYILFSKPTTGAHRLDGNLHYKYGKQYSSQKDWSFTIQRARRANLDFFTIFDPVEAAQVKDGYTLFKGMKHNEPSILSFDIESTGLFHNADSKVLLISNTFRKNGQLTRKLFAYDDYASQGEMLVDWCDWVWQMDPSIICGHNIYSFDLPYLNFIAEQEGIELKLGRDSSNIIIKPKASKFRVDGARDLEYHKVRVWGREIIDTMFLAIRHDIVAKKYDSYGLKSIIKAEGLEREDRQHYDSSQIRVNYRNPGEWRKIRDYCIHDSDDALALFDLCAPSTFYLTQSIPRGFQAMVETASGSQINTMMIRSYLQEKHSIPKASLPHPFEGAISFGNPGIYRNVHKVDVASLYPSIILECKVYDEDKDPKGNFLKIIEIFTDERLKNKKLAKETGDPYYEGLQNAQKIVINSGYGFMAAPGLNFNSPDAAEFITSTGRDILKGSLEWAERMGFNVPNADTDSISYCKRDGSVISELEQKENLKQINSALPEKIRFEDDGYFPTVCILKAKNYILFDGKKMKIKGSALKASTKSPALKEMIKRFIDSIINHRNDFTEIYNEYIKEAANIKDIRRWASRKTISERTLNSERKNETRIKDVLEDTEYVEGDRIWVYNKNKEELELVENFDGQYDVDKMLLSVYNTCKVFGNILDCKALFINYTLKKSKPILEGLLNETSNSITQGNENRTSLRTSSESGNRISSFT